jgi:hypothetical protein
MAVVESRFQATWPGGESLVFGLNEDRTTNAVLYTPSAGRSTGTRWGTELVLERADLSEPWLPLRIGETYHARIREVRSGSDAPMEPDTLVLSLDTWDIKHPPPLQAGLVLSLSTASVPNLRGVPTAIGGGPVVVRHGQPLPPSWPMGAAARNFRYRSMWQRHPRTALGWNDQYFYLAVVDGRQNRISQGMTLTELGTYLAELGCQEAINLDGGGSATLWCNGEVRNSPSDRGLARFFPEDMLDLPGLARRLLAPNLPITRWVAEHLSVATRELLTRADDPLQSESLAEALAWDFNRLIWGECVYQKDRFQDIPLSLETRRWQRRNPKGDDLDRLNRLLFEDAFPNEIARSLTPRLRRIANVLAVIQKPGAAPALPERAQ